MNLQLGLSFVAGLLTTLSPCVLPILPFLLGSALRKNKKAPAFMIFGLSLSFVLVGFLMSRFGSLFGLDNDQIKTASAVLLIFMSLFFLSKKLQTLMTEKLSRLANIADSAGTHLKLDETSNLDSLFLGCLLGVIWSPCAGPTLGVAISLASQKGAALEAFKLMLTYAVGASLPMLMIAYGLRSLLQKHLQKILNFTERSKSFFGYVLMLTGLFILLGLDKTTEAYLLTHLPEAWVDLITKY